MNTQHTWTVFVDGASRRNPGKSGAGIFIKKDGETVVSEGFYLGIKTNNQAEYLALLIALYFIDQYASETDTIRIASDSELMVKQLKGIYRIKNEGLAPLFRLAKTYFATYPIEMLHVLRNNNKQADALANKGVDSQKQVPEAFKELLAQHEIAIEL
jgi:ribonuclease HI